MPDPTESLTEFMESWYDRWAGPGEAWTFADLAASIVEDWLPAHSTEPPPERVRRECQHGYEHFCLLCAQPTDPHTSHTNGSGL